jgi:hypothetical protein
VLGQPIGQREHLPADGADEGIAVPLLPPALLSQRVLVVQAVQRVALQAAAAAAAAAAGAVAADAARGTAQALAPEENGIFFI